MSETVAHDRSRRSAAGETLDAVLKANLAAAEGMERIAREMIGLGRHSYENTAAALSALLDARSIEEVIAVQSDFAKSLADEMAGAAMRLSQAGLHAASALYDPIGERIERGLARLMRTSAA